MQIFAALLVLMWHDGVGAFHFRAQPPNDGTIGLPRAIGGGARTRIRSLRMSTSPARAELGLNFALAVLGDLHLKTGDMEAHEVRASGNLSNRILTLLWGLYTSQQPLAADC
jgi:hypothetical protein